MASNLLRALISPSPSPSDQLFASLSPKQKPLRSLLRFLPSRPLFSRSPLALSPCPWKSGNTLLHTLTTFSWTPASSRKRVGKRGEDLALFSYSTNCISSSVSHHLHLRRSSPVIIDTRRTLQQAVRSSRSLLQQLLNTHRDGHHNLTKTFHNNTVRLVYASIDEFRITYSIFTTHVAITSSELARQSFGKLSET